MHTQGSVTNSGFSQHSQGLGKGSVVSAVANAASKTGVDFTYLMEKASQESGLNARASAKTSSATGLFQFIENTWLDMVAKYGHKYGLGEYADKILKDNGRPVVADRATRREILNLRTNPEISALMAAEYTNENKATLEDKVKGVIGSTELYLAHFLGAGSAAKFLNALHNNPGQKAAGIFPDAAHANKSVFFSRSGTMRSLHDIYAMFKEKFSDTPGDTRVAAAKPDTHATAGTHPAAAPLTGQEALSAQTDYARQSLLPDFFPDHKTYDALSSLLVAQMSNTLSDAFAGEEQDDRNGYGRRDHHRYNA